MEGTDCVDVKHHVDIEAAASKDTFRSLVPTFWGRSVVILKAYFGQKQLILLFQQAKIEENNLR